MLSVLAQKLINHSLNLLMKVAVNHMLSQSDIITRPSSILMEVLLLYNKIVVFLKNRNKTSVAVKKKKSPHVTPCQSLQCGFHGCCGTVLFLYFLRPYFLYMFCHDMFSLFSCCFGKILLTLNNNASAHFSR